MIVYAAAGGAEQATLYEGARRGGYELSRESAERYDIDAREDLSSEARVRRAARDRTKRQIV